MQQLGRGRPKRFCKQGCRQRAYESRLYGMESVWNKMFHIVDCYICGNELNWSDRSSIVLDHMLATVHGGETNPINLRPVHLLCNTRKGYKFLTPHHLM